MTSLLSTSRCCIYWPKRKKGSPSEFLCHFNGADGSSSFIEENGHYTITPNGALLKTDSKQFGSASGYWDGTDCADIEGDIELLYTQDWTAQVFFKDAGTSLVINGLPYGAITAHRITMPYTLNGSTIYPIWSEGSREGNDTDLATIAISANTWHYLHIVNVAGVNCYIAVDGILKATLPCKTMYIGLLGCTDTNSYKRVGYIDEMRILKGTAITTYTVPTTEFPNP